MLVMKKVNTEMIYMDMKFSQWDMIYGDNMQQVSLKRVYKIEASDITGSVVVAVETNRQPEPVKGCISQWCVVGRAT